MLPLALAVGLGTALADPFPSWLAPPPAHRAGLEVSALGGLDTWPEGPPGTALTSLGGGLALVRGRTTWAGRYGGVLQGWQGGYWVDAHLVEIGLRRSGSAGPGVLAQARASALWGWGEVLGGVSGHLERGVVEARASLGPDVRGGGDQRSGGLGLGLQAGVHPGPRVTLVAVTELRSWGAQDFPRVYAESDLAAELEVHRRLVLALGVGVTAARGGTTEAWVAGLPPSGLTTGRAWLAPRWTLGRGWSAIGEVSGETSGPAYGRLRLMGGVEARFGRVSGQGPRPSAQPGMVFVLNAPGSDLVELVGSFTGWSPLPMERWPDGSWVLALDLPPGEHAYVYLVDGRPVTPPEAVVRRPDGFGGENGVITVAAPSPAPGD